MVVGVASESETKPKMESFISEKGIKYPIALDGKAISAYGVSGIPDAVLVGADGKVIWTGHPSGLKETQIEASLQNVTFIPPLPANLAKFNALLRAKKFGKAYLDLKKAVGEKKAPQAEAGATIAALETRMKSLLAEGEKARGEGDFYTVGKNLNQLKAQFAGTEESRKAADILKEVEKDQKARDQLKAVETLEKLERAMESRAFGEAYKGYKSLAKKFPGTKIEKIGSEHIATIEKQKLLSYRPTCPACKKDGRTCAQHRS